MMNELNKISGGSKTSNSSKWEFGQCSKFKNLNEFD
jgi:hypothetical protein